MKPRLGWTLRSKPLLPGQIGEHKLQDGCLRTGILQGHTIRSQAHIGLATLQLSVVGSKEEADADESKGSLSERQGSEADEYTRSDRSRAGQPWGSVSTPSHIREPCLSYEYTPSNRVKQAQPRNSFLHQQTKHTMAATEPRLEIQSQAQFYYSPKFNILKSDFPFKFNWKKKPDFHAQRDHTHSIPSLLPTALQAAATWRGKHRKNAHAIYDIIKRRRAADTVVFMMS